MALGADEEGEDGLAGDAAGHLAHQPRHLWTLCSWVSVDHEMTSFFGGGTFTAKIYLSKVGFIIDYELKMKFQENVYFTK